MRTKNTAVCAASPARLASLALLCPNGSKKSSSASPLEHDLGRPRSKRCRFHDAGTGRTVVVCAQKSARLLDLDCPVPQDASGSRLCGETAHVERWNNTLRQRLARFVRMTLSFSKSVVMHEACLLLFLHRYNVDRPILLK